MSVRYFTDLRGRRYAVPDEVLGANEVPTDLPEGERLVGMEEDPPEGSEGSRDGDLGYCWRLHQRDEIGAVEYVIAPHDSPTLHMVVNSFVTVAVHGDRIAIDVRRRHG